MPRATPDTIIQAFIVAGVNVGITTSESQHLMGNMCLRHIFIVAPINVKSVSHAAVMLCEENSASALHQRWRFLRQSEKWSNKLPEKQKQDYTKKVKVGMIVR
jgi:hypothetical protein